jgi:uncharacterized protein YndB with AHSA1/START domain
MSAMTIDAAGEREIVITRVFDAPRRLVWEAHTRPELVRRWLAGPSGWTMEVCDIDLRVGGTYRYVWRRDADGTTMGMGGVYREVVPPARVVSTERFDDSWHGGEGVATLEFVERAGRTTLTNTLRYDTREVRDRVLASPMDKGMAASFDRLDGVLADLLGAAG